MIAWFKGYTSVGGTSAPVHTEGSYQVAGHGHGSAGARICVRRQRTQSSGTFLFDECDRSQNQNTAVHREIEHGPGAFMERLHVEGSTFQEGPTAQRSPRLGLVCLSFSTIDGACGRDIRWIHHEHGVSAPRALQTTGPVDSHLLATLGRLA